MKCNKCIHSDVCYKCLDVMDDRYSPSYVENCVDFKEENLQPNIYRIVVIYKDEINMHDYKELADKNDGKLFTSRHHAHYINDYIRIDFVPLSQTCRGLRAHEILIDRGSYDRIDIEDVDIIEQVFLPMLRDYTSTIYPLHKCFRTAYEACDNYEDVWKDDIPSFDIREFEAED